MSHSQNRRRSSAAVQAEPNELVLNVIKNKGENAITKRNIEQETHLPTRIVTTCIKKLIASSLVREIPHAQSKEKHYIATETKPSDAVTGGIWYTDGNLDTVLIDQLKLICLKLVRNRKVVTAEGVYEFFEMNHVMTEGCTMHQIKELLGCMVLENLIVEVKSSGYGEYRSIPIGTLCYRCPAGNLNQVRETGAMASIPCGVCPRITQCTPDGLISPSTCGCYTKWLDF